MLKLNILPYASHLRTLTSSTLTNELSPPRSSINFLFCIRLGNTLMISALIFMTISILISYVYTEYFSLSIQITTHISTIITAGIVKLGYVIRCVGAHGLGHKVF